MLKHWWRGVHQWADWFRGCHRKRWRGPCHLYRPLAFSGSARRHLRKIHSDQCVSVQGRPNLCFGGWSPFPSRKTVLGTAKKLIDRPCSVVSANSHHLTKCIGADHFMSHEQILSDIRTDRHGPSSHSNACLVLVAWRGMAVRT